MAFRKRAIFMAALAATSFYISPGNSQPAAAQTQATQSAPPPLEAYGELSNTRDIALSPSGRHLAIVVGGAEEQKLLVVNSNFDVLHEVPFEAMKFRGISFAGDEALVFYRSQTVAVSGFVADKYEMTQALAIPLTKGKGKIGAVFGNSSKFVDAVFGNYGLRKTGDGWRGYYGAIVLERSHLGYRFDHGRPYLYEYDFGSGRTRKVADAPRAGMDRDWLVGADGKVAATFDMFNETGKWSIENAAGVTIASGQNPNGRAGLIGLGKDAATIIYSAENAESGERDWWEVPVAGGTPALLHDDLDIDRYYWSRENGQMLGYVEEGADKEPVFFDPALQARAALVRKTFAGRNGRMLEWTPDLSKVVLHTNGNGDSGSWYLVDLEAKRAEMLGQDRPLIPADQVGPISTIDYVATDGLEMDGILTLPPGREAKNLPVIMLPHGGPASSSEERFNWWAQAFASRGYAVFQPNFRGSTGRGADFRKAGNGEWGRKMQTDISDGLAHLAKQGIVDPSRACIVGASYGGYAALAGVTLQQGLYRCAVAVNAVSDIPLMYRTEMREADEMRTFALSLRETLGDKERWREISPRHAAERADAPILLIHGKDDTVVAFEQSHKMADALKDAGKPHSLITLDGEDHWLSTAVTRKRMLEEAMAFVISHNPAD